MVGIGGPGVTIGYIVRALLILAHLVGLVLAIILVVKKKGLAAILAAAAFALLLLIDVGNVVQAAAGQSLVNALNNNQTAIRWVFASIECCCGALDLIAIICLIIAIFKGIGAAPGGAAKEEVAEEGDLAPTA
jgi:hypothetical protein